MYTHHNSVPFFLPAHSDNVIIVHSTSPSYSYLKKDYLKKEMLPLLKFPPLISISFHFSLKNEY